MVDDADEHGAALARSKVITARHEISAAARERGKVVEKVMNRLVHEAKAEITRVEKALQSTQEKFSEKLKLLAHQRDILTVAKERTG